MVLRNLLECGLKVPFLDTDMSIQLSCYCAYFMVHKSSGIILWCNTSAARWVSLLHYDRFLVNIHDPGEKRA